MSNSEEIRQLDRVQILTTKNVRYRSDRPGRRVDPHGFWSVIGFIGKEILIAKGTALVRIPIEDVRKVGEYDKMAVIASIKSFLEKRHSGQKDQSSNPNRRSDS